MLGSFVAAFDALLPAAAPHLEGEQQPDLLHAEALVGGPALAEIGGRAAYGVRIEDPGLLHALRVQVLVEERGQLPAQPPPQRDREALLGPVDQLARHM